MKLVMKKPTNQKYTKTFHSEHWWVENGLFPVKGGK